MIRGTWPRKTTIRKLNALNNQTQACYITPPLAMLQALGWKPNDMIRFSIEGDTLVLSKTTKEDYERERTNKR